MSDEQETDGVGRKVVDTTTLYNEKYRTKELADDGTFKSGADAFNTLSPVPSRENHPIDLGDGRLLSIQDWNPEGNADNGNFLPISITGYIQLKGVPPLNEDGSKKEEV